MRSLCLALVALAACGGTAVPSAEVASGPTGLSLLVAQPDYTWDSCAASDPLYGPAACSNTRHSVCGPLIAWATPPNTHGTVCGQPPPTMAVPCQCAVAP
jgi:hypothetical protein